MVNLSRKVDKSQTDILSRIAKELSNAKEFTLAGEIYQKMGDTKSLVQMHISSEQWDDVSPFMFRQIAYWLPFETKFPTGIHVSWNSSGI